MKVSQKALDIFLTVMFFLTIVLLAVTVIMQDSRMGESGTVYSMNQGVRSGTMKTAPTPASEMADEGDWAVHNSVALGFSLKAPKEVYSSGIKTPVNITEDDKADTIDIRYAASPQQTPGWSLKIATVKNDKELNAFINKISKNDGHGTSCFLGEREAWTSQEGVYSIGISGPAGTDGNRIDINVDNPSCFWGTAYYLLYYPAENKVMYVDVGQENTFYGSADNSVSYDADIIQSFRFK
jgi:hypothetical protein